MKQYLLGVQFDYSQEPTQEFMEAAYRGVEAFNEELERSGAWVFAGGLTEPSTATVVQVRDGDLLTTDGPYTETKEHLGGFWVIKAEDLDEALRWAEKATRACGSPVEVRPFQEEA